MIVFWAICTLCPIGSNSFSSLNFTPTAAKLAQPVNCFVVRVVDSFMMILLSQSSDSTRGMAHHCSFGKSLSCGSLPLVWAKFRLLSMCLFHPLQSVSQNSRMELAGIRLRQLISQEDTPGGYIHP